MASVEGYALPQPAIPKTLGILNVIFAVLLILFGLCIGGVTLLAPAFTQIAQKAQEDQKAQTEAQKVKQLKTLEDRAKDATTDEEKATIAKEREAVANSPAPVVPNFAQGTEILKDPRVLGFTVAQVVSGLVLHIVLLVAGVGLIRLTPWGRTLGRWWAGLQVVQLLILAAINFSLIVPIQQEAQAANIAELKKQAEGPNPPPGAAVGQQIAESSVKLAPAIAAVQLIAGLTYPIICLVLLRGAGARAACAVRPSSPPSASGYKPA